MQVKEVKKKSVQGVIVFSFQTIFLNLVSLLTNFVLMYYLLPEEFGVYGFVIQIIGLLNFFSDIGLASHLIQKKEEPSQRDYQTAFFTQQILSWVIVGIIFLILQTGFVFNKAGLVGEYILIALAFSFPLASLKTVPSIQLIRSLNFHKLVIPQIFENLFFNLTLIFMAMNSYGALSYVFAIAIRSVVGVIIINILSPWKIKLLFHYQHFKNLIKYGFKFQLNDLLARIKDQFFYLFLGMRLSLQDFGFLNWAKNWSMYPYNLTVQNILNITFPTFSRIQKDKKLLQRAIEKSIFFITLVIFPILATMCLFIEPLTHVVDKYEKWRPAVFSFIMFTASIGFSAFSSPVTNALNAIGKINQTLKLMSFWTVLTWVLSPILMHFFGFNGVALAAFLISLTSFLPITIIKKEIDLNFWHTIKFPFFSVFIMIIVGLLGMNFWRQNFYNFFTGLILVNLSYLSILILFGRKKLLLELKTFKKKND